MNRVSARARAVAEDASARQGRVSQGGYVWLCLIPSSHTAKREEARALAGIEHYREWDSEQLAKTRTMRQINLSRALLAPSLVKAAVEGRLPRGVNIERRRDPDPSWAEQFQDREINPN